MSSWLEAASLCLGRRLPSRKTKKKKKNKRPAHGATRAISSNWLSGLSFSGIFLVTAAANLAYSLREGRLAGVPVYDDVRYLSDALDRVMFAPGSGLWSVLATFWSNPPHAPLTTLTAAAGFWALGPHAVAAYLANLWVFALYIAVCGRLSRPVGGLLARSLFVGVMAYVPAAHAMIAEFRPDLAAGLLFAVALRLLARTNFRDASLKEMGALAIVAVAATVMKLSGVVLVIPALGIGLVIQVAAQYRASDRDRGLLLRHALGTMAFYLLLLAPFAIVFGPATVRYIAGTLFTDADIWATPGGWWFHLTYHLVGPGARQALGAFLFPVIGLVAVDLLLCLKSRNWRRQSPLPFYATLLVIYLAMAVSGEKTTYQGSYFYFPILLAAASALVRLCVAARTQWPTAAPRIVQAAGTGALAACIVFLPLGSSYFGRPADRPEADRLIGGVTNAAFDVAKQDWQGGKACQDRVPTIMTLDYDPLAADALQMALAAGGLRVEAVSVYFPRSLAEALRWVDEVDLVAMADPASGHENPWLLIGNYAPQIFRFLAAKPGMRKIAVGTYENRPYWLFANTDCSAGGPK